MPDFPHQVFLISPASLSGVRGRALLEGRSSAPFLAGLREGGTPLGDVYEFVSSLYFRGKRSYARAFARPPAGLPGMLLITSTLGLVPDGHPVTLDGLAGMAGVDIGPREPRYLGPLRESARVLAGALGVAGRAVLLGSLATDKYVGPLVEVLGARLVVPGAFVGRGDMSRGGLLLRAVDAGAELEYVAPDSLDRRGPRPPRLEPRPRSWRGSAPPSAEPPIPSPGRPPPPIRGSDAGGPEEG
jgi:hypothetical protein